VKSIELETERLTLRIPNHSDDQFFLDLLNSEGWLENIGDRNVKTLEQSRTYIDVLISDHKKDGYGFYVAETKDTGKKVAMAGLIKRKDLEDIDIGFAALPAFYKNGYTFEAAETVLKHAFDQLKLKTILAITTQENTASQKLLEKLGLTLDSHIIFEDEELLKFKIENKGE